MPRPRTMGERETIAMMALVMALQALAVDAMLPALGDIARELDVADPNRRQLVVGSFLLASGFASLVPGSLADRFGRRPVLLTCIAIYVVFSLACALVTSFDALLAMRVAQAMGCGGLAVLPGAIIRDRFSGDQMAKQMSIISVVFLVVPMLAPSIGQVVLLFAGWRWIFVFLAAMAVIMGVWVFVRLPETLHPEYRQPIMPLTIARNMIGAATNRSAIGYVLGGALTFGAMIGYVNSSQQLVGEHFGAGTLFPVLFGFSALMMAGANFSNSRIVERFGARRVSHTAVIVFIFVSALQTWFSSRPDETLWQFMPLMIANMILIGFNHRNLPAGDVPNPDGAVAAPAGRASAQRIVGGGGHPDPALEPERRGVSQPQPASPRRHGGDPHLRAATGPARPGPGARGHHLQRKHPVVCLPDQPDRD